MKTLSVALFAFFVLFAAPFRADAVVITGTISGPGALEVGELGAFTLNLDISGFQGTANFLDNGLRFNFGDGDSQEFVVGAGASTHFFSHSFLSPGDFIPTVTGAISGFDTYDVCVTVPIIGSTCTTFTENFAAAADISGSTVGVTASVAAIPAPGAALFLLATVGTLAYRRRRARA